MREILADDNTDPEEVVRREWLKRRIEAEIKKIAAMRPSYPDASPASTEPERRSDHSSVGGFGARRGCLRRDGRRNCSPYCRTIAGRRPSRMPTPPRSPT